MKSYTATGAGWYVIGRGLLYPVTIQPDEDLPKRGEVVLIDGLRYKVHEVDVAKGAWGRSRWVGLVASPEPQDGLSRDPQEEDRSRPGVIGLLGEISILKAKLATLEEEFEAFKQSVGFNARAHVVSKNRTHWNNT